MVEMELAEMHCEPILIGSKSLQEDQIQKYMNLLPIKWRLYGNRRLTREYQFANLRTGMDFVKEIELLAEQEQHYPSVCIRFPKVQVELSTHDISGLSENDFIVATRIDKLYVEF